MKQIVFVDDDESIRDVFELIFKKTDYQLINLDSPEKILNNEIDTPKLFLLDKHLAGADGLELCRYIKQSDKFKHVPVVMLSATPNIFQLAEQAGADDALVKPFSLQRIREVVSKYLQ